jgi:hypothetical protein
MATYPLAFPTFTGVRSERLELIRAQAAMKSPFTGRQQTVTNFSQWILNLSLPPMTVAKAESWSAWFDKLNGQAGSFTYMPTQSVASVLAGPSLGAVLPAYSETATIAGYLAGEPTLLRVGQFFQIGEQLFRITTSPANANGSGRAVIEFSPRTRVQYADNTTIEFISPKGIFRMSDQTPAFTIPPNRWCEFAPLEFEEVI